jgi:hypothetical protein
MLHCYGENSFTFLLFNQLERSGKVADELIANLKHFTNGKQFASLKKKEFAEIVKSEVPDVWLFPNFGKASGFGEPDAIVLCGGYSFWFEIETVFDLKKRTSSARTSLTQLLRFYYFAQALNAGKKRRSKGKSHWALTGPTINGKGEVKDAVLRVAGHSALQQIYEMLAESVENKRDHYVVFSERKMIGISKPVDGKNALHAMFKGLTDEFHGLIRDSSGSANAPEKPTVNRFWYSYYEGDLGSKVKINDSDVEYVRISTG